MHLFVLVLVKFLFSCLPIYYLYNSYWYGGQYQDIQTEQGSWLCNQCLSPLMLWIRITIRARCTTLCDNVCQWLATGRWFFPGLPVSSTNKTDHHDITDEILLKVTLNTIKQTSKQTNQYPIENRWKRHNRHSLHITTWPPTLRVRYRHCSAKLPGLIW